MDARAGKICGLVNRDEGIPKNVIVFGVAVPVALLLGYLVAQPLSMRSLVLVTGLLGILALPLLMQWHHSLLLVLWNATITPYFLPGQPEAWMLAVLVSLPFTLLARALDRNRRLVMHPSLAIPLLALVVVVLCTAFATGGIGLRSMGSAAVGGKRYISILLAIAGFFAISWVPVPPHRRRLMAMLFFGAASTALMSDIAYALGPAFYFLFNFFSVSVASYQIQNDFSQSSQSMLRLAGFSVASSALIFAMVVKWGLRGILDVVRPWRLAAVCVTFVAGLMGGFRSMIVIVGLVLCFQFLLEKLHKTRFLFYVTGAVLAFGIMLLPFVDRLPMAAQRTLSIVPGMPVSQFAKDDATISSDWRLEMWRVLMPEVPRYLWVGKGYAMNMTDYYLAQAAVTRGVMRDFEPALISGEYHNGILTLVIPLGIWGLLAFLAFLLASGRALYLNHRHGDPEIQIVNTFIFAYFLGKTVYYFAVFGNFSTGLADFTGTVALSLSLNRGICTPSAPGRPVMSVSPPGHRVGGEALVAGH